MKLFIESNNIVYIIFDLNYGTIDNTTKKKHLFINEEKNNEINTVNYYNSDNLNVFY